MAAVKMSVVALRHVCCCPGAIRDRPGCRRSGSSVRFSTPYQAVLLTNGSVYCYIREICDACGRGLGPVRFTRRGEARVGCSRECREDAERPTIRRGGRPRKYETGAQHWLPWVRENCKPSTVAGYGTIWKLYLAPYLQKITLRDFRTVDAANLFSEIHRNHGVGRTTLSHCKRRLSGIFTLARNQGALDAPNPIQGSMVPNKASAPVQTHAATPDEVLAILVILEKAGEWKARAAVALMFFAGLRPGEARGARWEDFDGKRLFVWQSVWHTFTTDPKTFDAASPVPVIETLADILSHLRGLDGNPTSGPILRGPSGKP